MKYISFCSGIEAASQAWESLGWEPVAFCEIDKFPSRVLAHHYPNVPNLGDFTKVDWSQWSADICVGGTPCQAFSVAGLRKSLSDERGNLSLEFIRAVNIIRPRFVVWENVPGVLSTPDNAFGCFLAGLVGCEEPIVFEQGWPNAGVVDGPIRRCAWRVLDAQYFGLAQRRRRVFVVASSGDGPHPAEILFEWEGLRRDSPPSREAGECASAYSPSSFGGYGEGGGSLRSSGGDYGGGTETVIAMCLNASMGKGKNGQDVGALVPHAIGVDEEQNAACELMGTLKARREGGGQEAFVAHSLRADGFDASEDGTGRGTLLVPVAVMENQRGELRLSDCTNALTKGGGKPGQGYASALAPIAFQSNAGSFINAMEDCTPTLRIGGDGGNAMAVAIQAGALRENPNSGPDGVGVQEHIAYTLEARAEVQAVAFEPGALKRGGAGSQPNEHVSPTLRKDMGDNQPAVSVGMAVRRLTPREAERLQGFPDDYTLIPGAADGPRYKALGNSMAVPVMAWIGRRIQQFQR